MSFPASPVLNEIFIANGKAWKFDGTNWVIPQKASTLPWELVTNKPSYFPADWSALSNIPTYLPADWSSTLANIPNYFNAKVISSELPPTNQVTGTLWWDELNQRLYVYQSNVWVETSVALREKFMTIDPDVINYVTAVEAADGAPLEQDVVTAFEAFIRGCKIDGIWNSIKASCILAGARTIAGATTPLKGPSPTSNLMTNYNRKTGLYGVGSNSTLFNTGYANNIQTPSNRHLSLYATSEFAVPPSSNPRVAIGGGYPYGGWSGIFIQSDGIIYAALCSGFSNTGFPATQIGFLGASRNSTASLQFRANNTLSTISNASTGTARPENIVVNSQNVNSSGANQRTAFYSIGESIDLEKLDARVTKLMTTLSTVIP